MESTSSKVDLVALKMKSDDKKPFKKKGIEYQYKHNSAVIENYDEIETQIPIMLQFRLLWIEVKHLFIKEIVLSVSQMIKVGLLWKYMKLTISQLIRMMTKR